MGQIYGVGSLNTSSGTEKLIAIRDRHAWVFNAGTGNWDLAAKGAGRYFTTSTNVEHEEFLNMSFWTDGSSQIRSYDGSTWSYTTNVTDAPFGKYIRLFQNRLYLANIKLPVAGTTGGVLSFPSRVWFSNLPEQDSSGNWRVSWGFESGNDLYSTSDPNGFSATVISPSSKFVTRGLKAGNPFVIVSGTNAGTYTIASVDSETQITLAESLAQGVTNQVFWCGGNWFDVKYDDSDVITGLGDNSNRLSIYKRDSLHRWDGSALVQVKGVPGTTSQRSVLNLGDYSFYFHPSGWWRDNGVTAQLISEPIWDIVANISSSNYAKVIGWTDNARFVKIFVGDVSASLSSDLPAISKCVLVYDITMDNFSTQSLAHTITATTPWVESGASNIYAGASDGQVYQLETGTDFDGAAIPCKLRTQVYYPISAEATVVGERIEEFSLRGDGLQVGYRRILQPGPDDITFYPLPEAFLVNKSDFRGIQFELIETSAKTSFLLEKLTVYYSGGRLEESGPN